LGGGGCIWKRGGPLGEIVAKKIGKILRKRGKKGMSPNHGATADPPGGGVAEKKTLWKARTGNEISRLGGGNVWKGKDCFTSERALGEDCGSSRERSLRGKKKVGVQPRLNARRRGKGNREKDPRKKKKIQGTKG